MSALRAQGMLPLYGEARRARFARKACPPFIEKHDEHASRLKRGAYDCPPCARADDA
jgi:hypothetical protein